MCQLSKQLRTREAQAARLSENVGNLEATRALRALAQQYSMEAEALEQADYLISQVMERPPAF